MNVLEFPGEQLYRKKLVRWRTISQRIQVLTFHSAVLGCGSEGWHMTLR